MAGQMRVIMDISEPRPYKGRLAVGADGSTWDYTKSENVWIDPCTSTVMLKPLPLTTAWKSTFTGNYARYGISDFTGTDIAKWHQLAISKSANDKGLKQLQTSTAQLNLTTALPANCPMYFKYYRNSVQESGDDVFLVLGYNVGAGGSAPNNFSVQVKFRDNGSIAIFRNGVLQKEYDRSGSNFSSARTYTSIFNPAQKYVNVLLIPFRGRELLIWTDNGTCLSHTFENLDYPNDIATAPILPAGTFSVVVPNGKITFQCARCYFEQSGYILGAPKVFRYAPTVGDWNTPTFQTYHEYFGDGATYPTLTASIVDDTAGYPAFVPNGTRKNVRIKVAYTAASGGTNSGLYCSDGWMDPDYSSTALGHQVDITTAVESLSLSLGEDGRTGLEMTTRVKRLIDLGVSQPTITGDRPIAIQLKSNHATKQWVDLFRGTLSPPEIIYEPGDGGPQFSLLRYSGEDRFGDFDVSMCQESIPLDGDSIGEVFYNIMPMAGYDPAIYLQQNHSSTFTVPQSAEISKAGYAFIPKRGDYPGGVLQQFRDTYLANFFMGWKPTALGTPVGGYMLAISDPASVGNAIAVTLYQSTYDAIAYGSYTAAQGAKRTVRNMKRYFESPEANQIAVIGADPKTNQLLYNFAYVDVNSQDPTYAPSARPQNWRGRPVEYILSEPSLTSQNAVDQAAELLGERLINGRQLIEWESDLLTYLDVNNHLNVVWIGDVVEILEESDPDNPLDPPEVLGTYQVVSIPQMQFIKEQVTDNTFTLRQCVYKGIYKSGVTTYVPGPGE